MKKEKQKQVYSAPSSELLEMAQETIICASTTDYEQDANRTW